MAVVWSTPNQGRGNKEFEKVGKNEQLFCNNNERYPMYGVRLEYLQSSRLLGRRLKLPIELHTTISGVSVRERRISTKVRDLESQGKDSAFFQKMFELVQK